MSTTTKDKFAEALRIEMSKAHGASAKDAWKVGGVFTDMIKKVIDSIGLGDLTKEEFLFLVATAFDTFTASMGIPPMLAVFIKGMVLMIAGKIWDKRHKPTPTPVPVPTV